ncbi:MAG: Asd/ArgC dimerization domain-containing protein [Pseudomonadota bacterium]
MDRRYDVAVLGADSAVGEALLELIAERRFPAGEVSALALQPDEEATVELAGHAVPLEDAASFDFAQVQLAFLASDDPRLVAEAERAADTGCTIVDASGAAWSDPAIPRVIAELNADALAGFAERGIVAAPDRIVVALMPVLAVLDRLGGIRRVTATVLVPVSDGGRAAFQDLARETTALLNARHYARSHFAQQIAFNVQGQIGAAGNDGATAREARIAGELRDFLRAPQPAVGLQLVQSPCFYGYAMGVEIELAQPLELLAAATALRAAAGVELVDSPDAADCPSPVADATRSAAIRVARLRPGAGPTALAFWLTADNIRRAAAGNALACAERLVADHL